MAASIDIKMNNYIINLDLSMNHKFILALADTFKENGCFMSNAKIGKLIGISASRVSHIISELVMGGYLTRKITYKEDSKEVDKRTIFFNKTIRTVQETVKRVADKVVSKAKEMKQAYTTTKTVVGTQQVDQLTFGQSHYQRPTTTQNKAQKRKCNIHAPMCSHGYDYSKLEVIEQNHNYKTNENKEFVIPDYIKNKYGVRV